MPVACQSRAVTEPQRDSPQCAHWGKGSPELSLEQMGKERADLNNHCHSEERSDVGIRSPLRRTETYCCLKETRIATASDVGHWPRNDSGFYTLPFLLPIGTLCPPRRPLSRLRGSSHSRGAKGCGKVPQVLFNLTRIIYHNPPPLSSGITELSQNFLDKVAV